jgi:DNA-binding CsgD family transcriptional regulator
MTAASALLAEVAARYGATVAPDAKVQRVPRGVSGRPLPVWNGHCLICPDWKEQDAARRRAGVKRARAARRRNLAEDAEVIARLRGLHAAGAGLSAMAEALDLSQAMVRRLLRDLGLAAVPPAVPPAARPAAPDLSDRIRALAAEGRGEAEIGAVLGIRSRDRLRRLIRAAAPGVQLEDRRKSPETRAAISASLSDRKARARAERDLRIRALLASGADVQAIGAALGIRDRSYLCRVIRAAAPDLVDPAARTSPEARAAQDEAVRPLLASLSCADIAARLGISLSQVRASFRRLRAAGRLPEGRLGRRPARAGRKLGARPQTAALHEAMRELASRGLTAREIAAAVGRSADCVRNALRAMELRPVRANVAQADARRDRVLALVAEGLPGIEIAARCGLHPNTVYAIAARAGLSLRGTARRPAGKEGC